MLHRSSFQPTRPLRGATAVTDMALIWRSRFQPTRPLRGATAEVRILGGGVYISTHAPLAGRDLRYLKNKDTITISTHAPLAGRDDVPTPF